MKLLKRIKNAWGALTDDDFVRRSFITQDWREGKVGNVLILLKFLSYRYFSEYISDPNASAARIQMFNSILTDPSVILQSIHDGKPTVIYDCSSEEDLQTLLSQDIENV